MEVGVPELLIILVIVILLFGVGRIAKTAGELGSGIRAFRKGLEGDGEEQEPVKVVEHKADNALENKEIEEKVS